MKKFTTTNFLILMSIIFLSTSLLLSNKSQAQNSSTPFAGSCGGVFNINSIYDVLWEYTGNSLDSEGISVMMSMNFDTKKADFAVQNININKVDGRGFGSTLPPRESQVKTREHEIISSLNFDIEPINGMTGAFLTTIQFPNSGSNDLTFLIMPVNGGNTFLIQGKSFSAAGVCQKV